MKQPFNLQSWIEKNESILKPPVGNKNLYHDADDYIVMIVGGPNMRKDYHYNETEELFYQLKGNIEVKVQEDNRSVTIPIREGEMFLLPAKVPHSPVRFEHSIGLVVELKRKEGHRDGLIWYCDSCNHLLHESYFRLTNIEKDFFPRFKHFYESEALRTCSQCGDVMEADKRFSS